MADTVTAVDPIVLTTSAVTMYTCNAATVAQIIDINVVNEHASATATLTISKGTDGAGKRIVKGLSLAPGDVYQRTGVIKLGATQVLQAYSDTASALTFAATIVETT